MTMPWYYSPILCSLILLWTFGGYYLLSRQTGNEGGMILKLIVGMIMGGASIALIGLDLFVRHLNWNKWSLIGFECITVAMLWVLGYYLFHKNKLY